MIAPLPSPVDPTIAQATGPSAEATVLRVAALPQGALAQLLHRYGMALAWVVDGAPIPGSYWGESEAGLVGATLHLRADTPVHSALHEASHCICMDAQRRTALHTDARSDQAEEDAVCYLQVLLADRLAGFSRARMFADMDAWGYNFALGSARAWFERDAGDARAWLEARGLNSGGSDDG